MLQSTHFFFILFAWHNPNFHDINSGKTIKTSYKMEEEDVKDEIVHGKHELLASFMEIRSVLDQHIYSYNTFVSHGIKSILLGDIMIYDV